jgi:hypothetical protein
MFQKYYKDFSCQVSVLFGKAYIITLVNYFFVVLEGEV